MKLCEVSDVQWGAVAGQLVPMRVGDGEVLVQTISVAGSEPTSTLGDASQRVLDAFERAHQVIVRAAASTAKVINKLGAQGTHPQQMEVEFGLGFSAAGNVIVAGASAKATLNIRLLYEAKRAHSVTAVQRWPDELARKPTG